MAKSFFHILTGSNGIVSRLKTLLGFTSGRTTTELKLKGKYSSYKNIDTKDWRWHSFTPQEIACKGTGEIIVNRPALDKLQLFRDMVNCPVILNSAYRSESHNIRVGGSQNSQHLLGTAFDIRITPSLPRDKIILNDKLAGFNGIGQYDNFVHIETGTARTWDLR